MARPNLSALFSKFLFRETLTSDEKGYIRSDIGADTAGAAATAQALAISTAAADATAKVAAAVSDEAYDATAWNGVTVAPTKNSVRDKIVSMDAAIDGKQPLDSDLTALAAAGNSAVLTATTASFTTADETKLDALAAPLTLNYVPGQGTGIDLSSCTPSGANGVLVPAGSSNGKQAWSKDGTQGTTAGNTVVAHSPTAFGTWTIIHYVTDNVADYSVSKGGTDASTPVSLTGWNINAGSGQPSMALVGLDTPTGTLGQPTIVSHSDGTQTAWDCVDVSPMTWLPRTAGVIKHASGSWYRQTLASDGTAEYTLLPNQ